MQSMRTISLSMLLLMSHTMTLTPIDLIPQKLKNIIAYMMNNRIGFHVEMYINQLKNKSDFTFHKLASDIIDGQDQQSSFSINYDATGKNIIALHDGKKTPLILSSIPYKTEHISRITATHQLKTQAKIGVFTLNDTWEYPTSGLDKLIEQNTNLTQYRYPTEDYTAPLFIDIVRAVYDLQHRDEHKLDAAIVHCKAGRGRSATMIAAYLLAIAHQNNVETDLQQITAYMKLRRPTVALKPKQQAAVNHFYDELKKTGNLDTLYEKYSQAIQQRESEITALFSKK